MGVNPGDLDIHGCRKGVATTVPDGCKVYPLITYICIRCGWPMGIFNATYLKYEAYGDQYVDRCASSVYQKS